MKTSPIAFAFGIAVLTINTAFSQSTISTATATASSIPVPQPQFPFIILQPVDQNVHIGSNATFSVLAENADGYQWLCNGNAIANATNSTLTIQNAQIQNVSLYSCEVYQGMQYIPTRSALLQVYTNWIDPQTGVDPMVVFSFAYPGSGSAGSCPGPYSGYVYYTPGNAWGWAPDTTNGNTLFTATDTNRINTKIQYVGEYGDNGCDQTTVTVPSPAFSPQYEFCIYFTNNVPTNAYPITLSGFSP
jgi:hypothetical protein